MKMTQKNPTPEARPDLYDHYDIREIVWHPSQAHQDAVLPEHVKRRLAELKDKARP
jgi:hypothetical protein